MQSHREERNYSSRKGFNEVEKGINISVCLVWNMESHTRKKYKEFVICPVRKWLLHKSKTYCPKEILHFLGCFLFSVLLSARVTLPSKAECQEASIHRERSSDNKKHIQTVRWSGYIGENYWEKESVQRL